MAPVIRELDRDPGRFRSVVCVTGQHREMVNETLALFRIKADYDLHVMKPNQRLSALTALLFERLDPLVREVKPDWILAQGDTTTSFVASIVAYYNRIRFGHVEAGLRTGSRYEPFPEEFNRIVADQAASLLFAPTEWNRQNLLREGLLSHRIIVTGNTVVDALYSVMTMPFSLECSKISVLPKGKRLVLITAHRRESFGEPLKEILLAIRELAESFAKKDVHFVYPVHPNPNVQKPVMASLSSLSNISLLEPLDYLTLVNLMQMSEMVLTDSGGIQEEAPSVGIPTLVMRQATERSEGLDTGLVKLVGTDRDRIVREASVILNQFADRNRPEPTANPYGDGHAASRIVRALVRASSQHNLHENIDRSP
jgi:UDP-N-acetylglucosamine 2-epimerase (non-hydrolysing)